MRIDPVDVADILQFIKERLAAGRRAQVLNANAHLLNLAARRPWLRDFMNAGDIVFCDGFGAKLAARLVCGVRLPRLTPPDWIDALVESCAEHGRSLFFLGGAPGVAAQAIAVLARRHPAARFAGAHHGFFDKTKESEENRAVLQLIKEARPDILLVCFGMPIQERWILENWDEIAAGIVMPAGALVDYVAGTVARGPRWATDHGFEWITRLLIEPRRLWHRYIVGLPVFFMRVGCEWAAVGLREYFFARSRNPS